jgi:hypothetical protein
VGPRAALDAVVPTGNRKLISLLLDLTWLTLFERKPINLVLLPERQAMKEYRGNGGKFALILLRGE